MDAEVRPMERVGIDVHQHLWTPGLVELLPTTADLDAHDPATRDRADALTGVGERWVCLPEEIDLGSLPPATAHAVVDAWHRNLADAPGLPGSTFGWAALAPSEPDLSGLAQVLRSDRCVGVQLDATTLTTPQGWERAGEVLRVAELADRPVLVHPGSPLPSGSPSWWTAVVEGSAQLRAAWWAWWAGACRRSFPDLRLLFAAGAGLAPLHEEHHRRDGRTSPPDAGIFVDTAGNGGRALGAVARVLGIEAIVLGSDRPHGELVAGSRFAEAATHAVRVDNPRRLLGATSGNPTRDLPLDLPTDLGAAA